MKNPGAPLHLYEYPGRPRAADVVPLPPENDLPGTSAEPPLAKD